MKRKTKKTSFLPFVLLGLVVLGIVYYFFFSSFSRKSEVAYVYVDADDTIDSVYVKLAHVGSSRGMTVYRLLAGHSSYRNHVRSGRYAIRPGEGVLKVFRHMKNGQQTPVQLTVPSVRTLDKLAGVLSDKLMLDSAALYKALTDEAVCRKYGYDTTTIACMFIPNTYDI